MLDTTRTTGDLQALDGAHHVHSFTDPAVIASGKTRVVVRGEGCQIWDNDGRRFLDGMAGLWCVNVGYGRQELVDAATRQMAELPFYSNHFQSTTPAMTELAHKLSQLTPEGSTISCSPRRAPRPTTPSSAWCAISGSCRASRPSAPSSVAPWPITAARWQP
jgi:4-aminobutyrate aminotransferase-like enzyme